jgi:EF hand
MKAKLTLIASALLLMSNIAGAQEQSPSAKMAGQEAPSVGAQEQSPSAKMMGCKGTMGQGMHHGYGGMYRIMFVLMDTDGDGTISLEEFQAAHAKIFKAIDANKDGKVTFEEMQAFFRGGSPTSDE